MTHRYYGTYNINGGAQYNAEPYKYNSIREARKSLRAICVGSTPLGGRWSWAITRNDDLDPIATDSGQSH